MKKQIVINASKDRSRIAIVENGELVELYIENPDNVRSIGNIYLGRVQKVMPAIRAAFVDVGEKQDCFLHFSDLTDNLPQLLAFAGEDVPGLDEPVLSLAPAKRVADDEDEPDVEEALEVEPAEDESTTRRSRGRRSRGRGRGRGRGSRREEEEEEEEAGEGRRPLPSVLDLSSAPRRRPTRSTPEPTPEPAPESETADEATPEPEAEPPKPARRTRAKKTADAPPEPAEPTPDAPADEDRQPDTEAPAEPETNTQDASDDDGPTKKKRRRGRRGRGKADGEEATDEASDAADDAPAADDDRQPSRRRGSKGARPADAPVEAEAADEAPKPKRRSKKKADAAEAAAPAETAPEPEADDEDTTRRKPLPRTLDLSGSGGSSRSPRSRPATRETAETTSEGADEADEPADETEAESTGRSRRRSRGGRSETSDDTAETSDDDRQPAADDEPKGRRSRGRKPSADTDEAPADAEPRSRRGGRSTTDAGADAGADAKAEDATDDRASGGSSNGRSAGGRSGRSRSDSRGDSRSDSRSGSRGDSRGDAKGSGDRKKSSGPIPPNEELLRRDGRVLVKITKEAISTKGPRASTDLSLAGRFLVLVPAADYVAVSKKIESAKERRRLRTLAQSLKPDGFGVIVRTVAEGRDAKSLDTDLRLLADRWRKIDRKLKETPEPPVLLYQDVNMVSSIIRDLFSDDFDRILVDDPKVFKNVQAYVKAVAPDMADKVELHQGRSPVYRSLGIEKQVEEAFSKRVNMRGGGYLFIETTEAMHVVDVNSGRAGRGKSQKQNLLDVNVEAAREVAKQLRLRDLGGIIVVDFIDLKYDRDRRKVTDALKEAFKKDRAVTKILPMSDFGLVQITRQRLRPSITTQATDDDGEPLDAAEAAAAAGAGEIPRAEADHRRDDHRRDDDRRDDDRRRDDREPAERPERPLLSPEDATPQALSGRLRGWLDHYRRTVDEKYRGRPIAVRVHPLFGAYLRRGFPSPLTRWRLALRGVPFVLEDDAAVDPLSFEVRDQKSGRSLVKKYAA